MIMIFKNDCFLVFLCAATRDCRNMVRILCD